MEKLEDLIAELNELRAMPEEQAIREYNVDYKEEAIQALEEEIQCAKNRLPEECDYTEEELEAERSALCFSQGISRFC